MKKHLAEKLNSNNGMSIIQILIAASIMMTIIYGIISMLMFSARQQHKQTIHSTLVEVQKRLQSYLNDPGAWQKTFLAPANASAFSCINGGCVSGTKNMILEIRDATAAGMMLSNLPNDWANPTYPSGGFTDQGVACNNFNGNPGFGNDSCPFTYKIVWEPVQTMANPAFRITARLIYNPSASSYKTVIQLGSETTLSPINSLNIGKRPTTPASFTGEPNEVSDVTAGKYDVVVWRTAGSNIPTFRAVSKASAATCSQASAASRTPWQKDVSSGGFDPFDLITIQANTRIHIKIPGTYECEVMGTAMGIGGFRVFLTRIPGAAIPASPPVPLIPPGGPLQAASSSGFASNRMQSAAQFILSFQHLNTNDEYEVQQQCELSCPVPPGPALGYNIGGAVLASLSCRLINTD